MLLYLYHLVGIIEPVFKRMSATFDTPCIKIKLIFLYSFEHPKVAFTVKYMDSILGVCVENIFHTLIETFKVNDFLFKTDIQN
jgi:hypothetical protein